MQSEKTHPVINPATGALIGQHATIDAAEVQVRIEAAHNAFLQWRRTSIAQRSAILAAASERLLAGKERYAARITMEMGKPITQARAEIEKCVWVCRFYAKHAETLLAEEKIQLEDAEAHVIACPIGVIYAIMPWNFPFWQAFRAAVPALMAGNAMLLKGAPNVPGCTQDIVEIISASGGPLGLFGDLPINITLSSAVIAHPLVRGVTLTGSESAGRTVAAEAGANLKKCVLELGGSDPYLILEDADLQKAAKRCATSRMLCAGQVCIAAKRIIAVDEIYERFRDLLLEELEPYAMADPREADCHLGPLAREDLRDTVHEQVNASVAAGADLVRGGTLPARDGWWYPATVLENVQPGMPAYQDEIFGPVAALMRAKDTNHAVALASDTRFGLGAAIFSGDREKAAQIAADQIDAGCVAVNDLVRSDPRVPFGGTKGSGFGRELGRAGIHEFVNLKTVVVTKK